jgi:hypothetical protein
VITTLIIIHNFGVLSMMYVLPLVSIVTTTSKFAIRNFYELSNLSTVPPHNQLGVNTSKKPAGLMVVMPNGQITRMAGGDCLRSDVPPDLIPAIIAIVIEIYGTPVFWPAVTLRPWPANGMESGTRMRIV